MVVCSVENIENKIKELAKKRSIRVREFFQDFDRNKTGYVTKPQFFRVLYRNFGLVFSEEEENAMVKKYKGCDENSVDFKYFCCLIDREFNPKNFAEQSTGKSSPINTCWNAGMDERLHEVLTKINTHYNNRGLSIKNLCNDYDKNHDGNITQSQFYSSFVKPTNFTPEDMIILLQRYHVLHNQLLVRYLDLDEDLRKCETTVVEKVKKDQLCCPIEQGDNDMQSLLDRLSTFAHVQQFKTMDFFKVFDTLNKGFIHPSQFSSCLDQCFNKLLSLNEEECSKLVRHFERQEDGMVNYRSFCNMIDDAFLEADLEKKPTKKVFVPPVGYFGRKVRVLGEEEEAKVQQVLQAFRKDLRFFMRPLHYFFKDFDHHTNSGHVTTNQFQRVLSLCDLNVHPADFSLLCKKFAYDRSGFINYMAFLQETDFSVISRMELSRKKKELRSQPPVTTKRPPLNVDDDGNELSVEKLMDKIRNHVIINRVRVKEFFTDFDGLKTGRVTREQFKRALSSLGAGSIKGRLNFNDYQLNLIADHYSVCCNKTGVGNNKNNSSNNDMNNNKNVYKGTDNNVVDIEDTFKGVPCKQMPLNEDIQWNLFVCELERGYYVEDLDKHPTLVLKPMLAFISPKEGTKELDRMAARERIWFDELMNRLAAKILLSNIDMFLIFRYFDKLRHGHVSRLKFRQALGIAGFSLPDELSLTALESAFYDVEGINYIRFLDEISKKTPLKNYDELNRQMEKEKTQRRLENFKNFDCCEWKKSSSNVDTVLLKIKIKLAKRNLRVVDWFKGFDKFRTGHVSRPNFRRALDQCNFEIDEIEVSLLEDEFKAPDDYNRIKYLAFCEELESIFTNNNIGKPPSKDSQAFKIPKRGLQTVEMSDDENAKLENFMAKIKKKYRELRPALLTFMKDLDHVNVGSVSTNQFRRILERLNLVASIQPEELWKLLYRRFSVDVYGGMNVDYLEFHNWITGRES